MERAERNDGLAERIVNPRCLRDLENGFLAVRAVRAVRAVLAVLAERAVLAVRAERAVFAVFAVAVLLALAKGSGLFLNLAGKVIDLVLVDFSDIPLTKTPYFQSAGSRPRES